MGQVLRGGRRRVEHRLQSRSDDHERQGGEGRGLAHVGRKRGLGLLRRDAAGHAGASEVVCDADELG